MSLYCNTSIVFHALTASCESFTTYSFSADFLGVGLSE